MPIVGYILGNLKVCTERERKREAPEFCYLPRRFVVKGSQRGLGGGWPNPGNRRKKSSLDQSNC